MMKKMSMNDLKTNFNTELSNKCLTINLKKSLNENQKERIWKKNIQFKIYQNNQN